MSKKILFLNTFLYKDMKIGGAEQSSKILINELAMSNDIYTISIWGKSTSTAIKEGRIIGLYLGKSKLTRIKYINHFFNQLNLLFLINTYFIIKRINPDIIHYNNIQGFPALLIWLLKNYKGIHTLRDYNTLCFRNNMYRGYSHCDQCKVCKLQSSYKKWAYKDAINGIVSNSELTLEIHNKQGYERAMQQTVYAGYEKKINGFKEAGDKLNIGFSGRIDTYKGAHILNEIAQELSKYTKTKILVGGIGNQDIINSFDSEKIEHLGFVTSDDVFKTVDAIIVPSFWHDPFPRVIYEAFSYNVVPFVSIHTGASVLLGRLNKTLLFDPENKDDIRNVTMKIADKDFINTTKKRNKFDYGFWKIQC